MSTCINKPSCNIDCSKLRFGEQILSADTLTCGALNETVICSFIGNGLFSFSTSIEATRSIHLFPSTINNKFNNCGHKKNIS